MTAETLKTRSRKSLATLARRQGVSGWHSMTKDELVRALMRLARAKSSAPATRRRSLSAARRPSARPARNGAATKRKPKQNGQFPVLRSRDLCTTEVEDRSPSGRTNYIDTAVCDTHWLRAEWDLTRDSIRRAESKLAADWHRAVPILRLFEVATDEAGTVSDRFVKDVPIEAGVNTWYVNVPSEARTFRVHIGYRTEQGRFFAVAKSNVCLMPVLNVSLAADIHGKAGTNGHSGADHHPANGRSSDGEKPEMRLGRPLGFSSLAHFGPAASEEREKGEFSFKLETELFIHGSTRPGSCLAVQGDPVELRDDGSFTIRVMQPEGRQVIAFTAMSPRGNERRMIVLGVERNTKELERQYFDGGHPEGYAD
jgi:hypothetical protein